MDTICAIATPLGKGAISIIRVSGNEAITIVNKIFDKNLLKAKSHTVHYGHIYDNEELIDEVLVSVFKAPKTFTKEDVVEINCHGGIYTTNKTLELLIAAGARLAEAGEFTKRAFLNGRIDLTQAEAVMDVIEAEGKQSLRLANVGLSGRLSKEIISLRELILDAIAKIEVNIDYPEYDDAIVMTDEILLPVANEILGKIDKLLENAETGQIIRNGVNVAIIGKPNVGKSSLLNALLEEDKAIVTNIAGTTRDTVEGDMTIKGIALKLIDTAGIRETDDLVEKIGVDKAKAVMKKADIVILVFDNSLELSDADRMLLDLSKNLNRIIVLNKIDLNDRNIIDGDDVVKVSSLKGIGIRDLENKIFETLNVDLNNASYLSNARHIGKVREAKDLIKAVIQGLHDYDPIDMVEIDLKRAWEVLGEIIGDTYTDSLIDELFSKFCLGK